MEIYQMPILSDNYSHLIIDRENGVVAAIDPAEPTRLLPWLKENNLTLSHILCTHHHWDHAGGNEACWSIFRIWTCMREKWMPTRCMGSQRL